jgi:hypothetical protein
MPGLNLNNSSHAFRNIILNKKHNLDYAYGLNGDNSIHIEPGLHYEASLESPNVPFLTDYHPKILDYTSGLNVWGATDGYSGNVRRGNYSNQWDKRGNIENTPDPHQQINQPSNEIRNEWDNSTRNKYNSYLDYTNAIFLKSTSPINVLGGILSGDGVGLSIDGGKISVVSDFDIQQTLAGRIYSTATGEDTRLGRIGMKAAAISMANNILRKTTKMTSGLFKESTSWLLNKISGGKLGDDEFNMSKYATPSITDAPGAIDNILSSTGIGGVINTAAGGLGIDNLLSNNNWTKTATSSNDGKYVQINIEGVLVEYRTDTKPDLEKYLSNKQGIEENPESEVKKEVWGVESEYRRLQQSELIKWTGVLNAEQIYQSLSRNKYQPGYTTNYKTGKKLEYEDYQHQLHEIGYSANINNPFELGTNKNTGILRPENEVRIKNKRQIYTWTENRPKTNTNVSNEAFGDAVYQGIDETNIGFFNSGLNGVNNPNTLLAKTKRLFEDGKIKTIVSSFYQKDSPSEIQTSVSQWGISKGRNLLAVGGSTPNGYKDPYCRVWTWERQYRNVQNAIRPFLTQSVQDPGNMGDPIKLLDLHKKIEYTRPYLESFDRFTSLQDNGLPKIAPYKSDFEPGKFKDGWKGTPEERHKYNRNYFFSIENLAWKDQRIESILCPSQCGPNGGRIYWFSPLNLDFDETTNVNLNKESFIGRGEQVITYIDSIRTGTLSFTMVVDHSSFMEFMKYREFNNGDEDYQGILRWDAGCDDPVGIEFNNTYHGTIGTEEEIDTTLKTEEPPDALKKPEGTPPEPEKGQKGTGDIETILVTKIYFPNDFSGIDFGGDFTMNFIAGYLDGVSRGYGVGNVNKEGYRKGGIGTPGYEINLGITFSEVTTSNDYPGVYDNEILSMYNRFTGDRISNIKCNTNNSFVKENDMFNRFVFNMTPTDLLFNPNRRSETNYIKTQSELDKHMKQTNSPNKSNLPRKLYVNHINYWDVENHGLNTYALPGKYAMSFKDFYELINQSGPYHNAERGEAATHWKEEFDKLKKLFEDAKQVIITGNASSHGYDTDNKILSQNRADVVLDYLANSPLKLDTSNKEKWITKVDNSNVSVGGSSCASSKAAKEGRFVKIEIIKEITEEYIINEADIINYQSQIDAYEQSVLERDALMEAREQEIRDIENRLNRVIVKGRYDEEMDFYKYVDKDTDLTFSNIKDKYNHFIPAFWSLTPEGFNGRLNFLNQCTRQGPTISADDNNDIFSKNATNLSFGRPPVCILKVGDFIQSRIYIESLSIDYKNNGQIQWDLNPEGIGIQPLMANIRISFIYMGGQDLSGAIAQLQNAVTFNYYANTSVYDDRAVINKMEGNNPIRLFNPQKYENGNNYKAYLGTEQIDSTTQSNENITSPIITDKTIRATEEVSKRVINPMAVENMTEENKP